MKKLALIFPLAFGFVFGNVESRVADLEERMDAVEVEAESSKVKFSLEFNTALNNFQTDSSRVGQSRAEPLKWAASLYLNMNANVNKYTKFTGRLSMTKAFGDLAWNPNIYADPFSAGRGVGGSSAVYVERAYVDLFLGDYFALTFGRLPSTDGPGSLLRNGSARLSTYPALMVNALGDGAVLTYKPLPHSASDVYVRVGVAKAYQAVYGAATESGGSILGGVGINKSADMDLWYAGIETPFLPSSAGKSLLMLGYIYLSNYSIPDAALANIVTGDTTLNAALGTVATNNNTPGRASRLGDLQYINLHLEHNNAFGSNFHWFVSYSMNNGGAAGELGAYTQMIAMVPQVQLNTNQGWAAHIGVRYDFSSHFKLGYEYFHGNKNWYAFSRVSINDPFNIRNTRGDVHDVYMLFPIDIYQFFRLSYTYQYTEYDTPKFPTVSVRSDGLKSRQNIALSYTLRF
ncbi:DUF3373 family protein [Helicobacter sp. 23-1048]